MRMALGQPLRAVATAALLAACVDPSVPAPSNPLDPNAQPVTMSVKPEEKSLQATWDLSGYAASPLLANGTIGLTRQVDSIACGSSSQSLAACGPPALVGTVPVILWTLRDPSLSVPWGERSITYTLTLTASDGTAHSLATATYSGLDDIDGDGVTEGDCDDANPNLGRCDANATCTQSSGVWGCVCNANFVGVGTSCGQDCSVGNGGCDVNASCTNAAASGEPQCICENGYTGDGLNCASDCETNNGDCDPLTTCTNTPDSIACGPCPSGYTGAGLTGCQPCPAGYMAEGMTCSSDCETNNGGCAPEATCTLDGGVVCTCEPGWTGDGVTCLDVDECGDGTAHCDPNATCTNSPGSYTCSCNAGWSGNGITCLDADDISCLPDAGLPICDGGPCLVTLDASGELTPTGASSPYGIAVDSTSVYWTDLALGTVTKVPINGGASTVLASGLSYPLDLVVDATSVYWVSGTSNGGFVMKAPLAGGTPTTLAVTVEPLAIALDPAFVYWATPEALMKVQLDGGNEATLSVGALSSPGGIAVDSTNIYWTSGGDVMWMPLGGGPTAVLATTGQSCSNDCIPGDIVVDSTSAYWIGFDGRSGVGIVMKAPLVGGAPTVLAGGLALPRQLVADSLNVYWTNNGDGSVMMVPISGGARHVLATGQTAVFGIAVDCMSLYWTNGGNGIAVGGVMKLTPK